MNLECLSTVSHCDLIFYRKEGVIYRKHNLSRRQSPLNSVPRGSVFCVTAVPSHWLGSLSTAPLYLLLVLCFHDGFF